MKKSFLLVIAILIVMQVPSASAALTLETSVISNTLFARAGITNNFSVQKVFDVEQMLKPEIFAPRTNSVVLGPGESIILDDRYDMINAWPGAYEYVVEVWSDGVLLENSSSTFNITGTLRPLHASISLCADRTCGNKSGIFWKGQEFFAVLSNSDGADASAEVAYPNGTVQPLLFQDNVSALKFAEAGHYIINMAASKAGFYSVERKTEFDIIQNVSIPDISRCNANGVCEQKESWQACPQDCPKGVQLGNEVYFALAAFATAAILIAAWLSRKNKWHISLPKGL